MPGPRSARLRTLATLGALLGAVAVMTTLVSYSVTLYRLFCQATGSLGTTQRVAGVSGPVSDRMVTVRFLTSTAPNLPWRFAPVQPTARVRLGADTLVFFEAENLSDEPIVGHATFNVSPEKTGLYFKKIECFCFTEERLEPHQKVEMPVDFFVDPAMAKDRSTEDVTEIDLSYEFFRSLKPAGALDLARFDNAAGRSRRRREGVRDRLRELPRARSAAHRPAAARRRRPPRRQRARLSLLRRPRWRRDHMGSGEPRQMAGRPARLHTRRRDADEPARQAAPPRCDRLPAIARPARARSSAPRPRRANSTGCRTT